MASDVIERAMSAAAACESISVRHDEPLAAGDIELSIVMPCLNEAETLAACIAAAFQGIAATGLEGEIVVADNGSTDGSQEIAILSGARLVSAKDPGYGSALQAGIVAARGRFIVIGDSDGSYDFAAVRPFVDQLRAGHDFVMGNRFRGGVAPGAMPWLHRWFGTPALTILSRILFGSAARDIQCGMRAFTRDAYDRMQLQTTGMEFASEMVVKASLLKFKIAEVPIVLSKAGRTRPPHLRTWRDGWRNLRFMLLFSPRWLFLIPGVLLFLVGLIAGLWLLRGPQAIRGVGLDIHTLLVAGFACILGHQLIVFAAFTKAFAVAEGLHPSDPRLVRLAQRLRVELGIVTGTLMFVAGVSWLAHATSQWWVTGFRNLDPHVTMRLVIPACVLMTLGAQTVFGSFFLGILSMKRDRSPPRPGAKDDDPPPA